MTRAGRQVVHQVDVSTTGARDEAEEFTARAAVGPLGRALVVRDAVAGAAASFAPGGLGPVEILANQDLGAQRNRGRRQGRPKHSQND